jgi:hypothetical protein
MLLVTISTANAQNKVGFKTAFNYSSFRGNPNLKAGYQLGIAGKKYIGDLGWFFQPEVNYSLEGPENQRVEFINVPLIFGFDFSDNFNLHLGYQSGFLIGTRDNGSIDYKTYNPVINFGLEFYPSNRSVFGARYDYGISDIDKSDFSAITFNFEVYLIFWIKN